MGTLNGALKPLALVVDASVAAKLFLPEETYRASNQCIRLIA
jgi:hypothetical protein